MILDEISNELLSGFNLNNYSQSEIEEMKVNVIMNLYNKIILQATDSLNDKNRKELLTELQKIQPSYDGMLAIVEKYITNLDEFITKIMFNYKQEIINKFEE